MGRDFYQQFAAARAVFDEADERLSQNFSQLIFNGPSDELTETKNCQLAIYLTSVALLNVLKAEMPQLVPFVCAGLSLGEYSALTAAGMLSLSDGIKIVRARGEAMQNAYEVTKGSMVVVLGMEEAEVEKSLCDGACIANLNCPGQVVIAGTLDGLEKTSAKLKENGARRILPLEVSGAFHSPLMLPARERLTPMMQELILKKGCCNLVMNVPGGFVEDLNLVRTYMIAQVTSPVRWQKGIEAMRESGVELYLEIGPGTTLTGMNKRIKIEQPCFNLEKVADLKVLEEKVYATT